MRTGQEVYCIAHLLYSKTCVPRKPVNRLKLDTLWAQHEKWSDRKCILRYIQKISVHLSTSKT